jgi:MFS family permease
MLRVLRRRNFALLWFGGLISIAGDWVLFAALPYYVYQITGSTVATAGMIAAELLPSILLGSMAGVFVDRWDRKRILVASNLLQAAAVSLLLLVPRGGNLEVVYIVALAQSTLAAFSQPAESALLPTLVADEELLSANALNTLNNRLGRLAGVPFGAVLLTWIGLEAVVVVDCLSFVVAAALMSGIVAPPRPARTSTAEDAGAAAGSALSAFWGEWVAGLRVVRTDSTIAVLFVVFGLMTFGGTMLDPLTVAWVRDTLDAGPGIYAALLTVHAVSGIAGSLLVGALGGGVAPRALIGWASMAAGAVLLVKYNVPVVWFALALSVVIGVSSVASAVGAETLAQQRVVDEYRGRVFGSLQATIGLLSLLGAFVGGVLGEIVGVVPMLDVAALLTALAGAVVLVAIPREVPVQAQQADSRGDHS